MDLENPTQYINPYTFFSDLREQVEDPAQCLHLLSKLNELFSEKQLNQSTLDLYLLQIFNEGVGLLSFITETSKADLKKCKCVIFSTLYTLINNFPAKLERHVVSIHKICFKILNSSASAEEKIQALNVLIVSFEKIDKSLEFVEHYTETYVQLRRVISFKPSDSVIERILIALGTYAHRFETTFEDHTSLGALFVAQLQGQMLQKDPSYKVISGAFTALSDFCQSFPFDPQEKETIKKLYTYIDKLSIPKHHVKQANRAAFTFFAKNMNLFKEFLLEKFQYWHEILVKWLDFNIEEKKVGAQVNSAFYLVISMAIKQEQDPQKYRDILIYLLEYFKKILSSQTASNFERRLTLRGICSFSKVYQKHLTEAETKEIFTMIMQSFEQTYILNQEPDMESVEFLPSYIEAVSSVLFLQKLSTNEVMCLQRGVINMIKTFPRLSYAHHSFAIDALVCTFHNLKEKDGRMFDTFIENTVYQGVVWTCSHQHISEVEMAEAKDRIKTVKNYLGLWTGLLNIKPSLKYDKIGIRFNDRSDILTKLVEKLVKTLLVLINKLNVSIKATESNTPLTDLQSVYQVEEANDFAIFLNLIDFYEVMFMEIEASLLRKCISKLIHHFIAKSMKYPFISGFYKLISFSLQICRKIDHFSECNRESNQDISICYTTLDKFLQILLNKTNQFKDDLLIACLYVILEYPTTIIQENLNACVPIFRTIFSVGKSYIKLTNVAMGALELWQCEIPYSQLRPFLIEIIPLLDFYLQSKSLGTLINEGAEKRRKTLQTLKKRKIQTEIESDLVQLQKRILNFVGQQESPLCRAFVSSDNNIELAVWGEKQYLKVDFAYEDVKLEVYLDKLLPRIVFLAMNSSDRKTKIAACELLHSMVMLFLGTTKQMPHSAQSDLNELLRNLSGPLLKLACDLDEIVRQLFEPLFLQLIHWYTHPTQLRNEHTAIILDTIMDGITHPSDSALRDFSGRCVNEFMIWTIKQTNEHQLANDPINLKALTKKMRFFSLHPDPFKKLGAALIFNSMYREVREERALLSMFWMEFFHIFIKSLSTIEMCGEESMLIQINNAIAHLQRGFVEKSGVFNNSDANRRIPSDFKGGLLKDVVIWLLGQTSSKSSHCRDKAMELFVQIAPLVRNFKSIPELIQEVDMKSWIQESYGFLDKYPSLESLPQNDGALLIKWLQAFLRYLDGYNFIIKNQLLNEGFNELFFTPVQNFIEVVTQIQIQGTILLVRNTTWRINEFVKNDFNSLKSEAITKTCILLNTVLSNEEFVKYVSLNMDLWRLISDLIFEPQQVGFDSMFNTVEDHPKLFETLKHLIKKIPDPELFQLWEMLRIYITENLNIRINLKENVNLKQRNIMKGLLLLQSYNVKQFETESIADGLVENLLLNFMNSAEGDCIFLHDLQDTTINHCLSTLEFAINNEREFEKLIGFLHKPYQSFYNNVPVHFGIYLITTFEDAIIPKLLERFDIFLHSSLTNFEIGQGTIELLSYIFNYMNNKKTLKYVNEYVLKNIIGRWESLECYFNENIEEGINFLKQILPIIRVCNLKDHKLTKWISKLLIYTENSEKSKELNFKIVVFGLLVDFLDEECEDTKNGLIYMKNEFFVLSHISNEQKQIALDKLMASVPIIKVPQLLRFLLECYIVLPLEFCSVDLKNQLSTYITRNNEHNQTITLSNSYEMISSAELNQEQKYKWINTILPLFQYCNIEILEQFFVVNIHQMISIWNTPTTPTNVIQKISQYMLLEILYVRRPLRSTDPLSPITQALKETDNKLLLKKFLGYTFASMKEPKNSEIERLYKCHSYKAMVSVICAIKEPIFYNKLFVGIDWGTLIDTEKKFNFVMDFDTIPKQRKVLVNIRDEVKTQRKLESVKYVESQRIFNSSLSEDITKFDFTNTILRDEKEERAKENFQAVIALDNVDVNDHECMATVCGLIHHLINNISSLPTEDEPYVLPEWLKAIKNLLLAEETPVNVKVFWVKVIDNCDDVFRHFAKWFLEPLLKFIVDECAGLNINYFVADIVALLASWSTIATPSESSEIKLSCDLLTFIITHLNKTRQDVFKYHMELVKLLVESWKESLKIPYELLYSKLILDETNEQSIVGIHLSSIFLANQIAPWDGTNIKDFCAKIFNIVRKSTKKAVYKPAAETLGLVLKLIRNDETTHEKMVNNVNVILKKIEDWEKYAVVLEAITLHFPPIADQFHLMRILSRFDSNKPNLKTVYMKIIVSRSDSLGNVPEMKWKKWGYYIETDNLEVQLLALDVLCKCIEVLRTSDHFIDYMKSTCKLVNHPNVLCRSRMFDIAILICQNPNITQYKNVLTSCRIALINGLMDIDMEIREKILHYWLNQANLPQPISKRFSHILSNLYETTTENHFLGYSSYLLLDPLKQSPDFQQSLFEHPLEVCDFEDYQLQTNWRVRHLSVVPMFAETLRSFSVEMEPISRSEFGNLRQTQTSRTFAPTQTARMQQFSQYTMSESSLYVKPESEFLDPNVAITSHKYRVPRKRFLRDKSKIGREIAYRQVKKSVEKVEKRADFAKERENTVTIYRTYRKGDLPDVQISLEALLAPIQALGLHDGETSKILFLEIFDSLLKKVSSNQEFLEEVTTSINAIFTRSTTFNTNLFRALFDMVLLNRKTMIFAPDLIASASQQSGLTTTGVLLLEELLIAYDNVEESSEKRSRSNYEEVGEQAYWIKLAELYKDLEEWETVKAIFLEKIGCKENATAALMAESQKQWKDAQDLYAELIHNEESVSKRDFYYDSYFKCFANLGEWDKLTKSINDTVSSSDSCWKELWIEGWNKSRLLPWYISAQVKNTLFTEQLSNVFLADLNTTLCSEDAQYLQKFSEELAMLWVFQGDTSSAQHYVNQYIESFLENWQLLDTLSVNLRYCHLMKLRNVIDINKFLKVIANLHLEPDEQVSRLIRYWNQTNKENLPSIMWNETRVLYRKQFIKYLQRNGDCLDDSVNNQLKMVRVQLDAGLINAAIDKDLFYITRKYVNTYINQKKDKHVEEWFKLTVSKLGYIGSSRHEPERKVMLLLASCKELAPICNSINSEMKLSAHLQLFTNLEEVSHTLDSNIGLFSLKKDEIIQISGPVDSPQGIAMFAARKLESYIEEYESELNNKMDVDNDSNDYIAIGEAYVKLANFAKVANHFSSFVRFVLRAMKLGSSEAKQLFPCILIDSEFNEESQRFFIEESKDVPLWLFLGWIPQLLVKLDSRKILAVAPIIIKIAETYPQAIMYAYRLSKENYKFDDEEIQKQAKEVIKRLDEILLNDERIDVFLKALTSVGVPSSILLYYVKKMKIACNSKNTEGIKSMQETIMNELYEYVPDSRDVNGMQGNMFKKIKDFKKDINKVPKSKTEDQLKLLNKIDIQLKGTLDDPKENTRNSRLLKDYCPYLASFSADRMDLDLEIPGQYDGNRMPITRYHTRILGFCPNVNIMSSIRKPIKITILGNDTKEYPYLVKFGEDIRQDQRIQQLFGLINNIFENDKVFNKPEFAILTYKVVPLTTSLGIIQWIDPTISLQDFVEKPIKKRELMKTYQRLCATYQKWIHQTKNVGAVESYGLAAIKYSRDKTITKFRSLANDIPWDVMRTSFWDMSASTEAFLALRNNFIRSYAVMCVAHWILGIGDRHLNNSKICMKNGKVLGIDFGHAFGTATQILPVPELVPFRLTPHIVSLMEPLGERGLFRETMIGCLSALRSNTSSLLATMNVFIQEPSLDWLEHASKFDDSSESSSKREWYPVKKIQQAESKLNGANSTKSMIEDLIAGHQHHKKFMDAYIALVRGSQEFDLRARNAEDGLSVEDQVDSLIDHATDYNLLGRMYEGWFPWV